MCFYNNNNNKVWGAAAPPQCAAAAAAAAAMSEENLTDNEVNIGLLNSWIVRAEMFAVILWSLFAHIRSQMTSLRGYRCCFFGGG